MKTLDWGDFKITEGKWNVVIKIYQEEQGILKFEENLASEKLMKVKMDEIRLDQKWL